MDNNMENKILELLGTVSEALEYEKETGDMRLSNDIGECRDCVEVILNRVLGGYLSERIDTGNMPDADWLLAMYRIMDEITHPLIIKNQYDREFLDLLNYVWNHSKEQLLKGMKNALFRLKQQSQRAYDGFVAYFSRFPLWGTLEPEREDYHTFELRAAVLKQKSYEFLWLYKRLEDYLSKRTLCAVLKNWAILDFNDLTKIKSIFPDYYEPDIFPDNQGDVFVDVGAFNGDSILQYINMYGANYKKIYAYEISEDTFSILNQNTSAYKDIITRQKGAGAQKGFMYINQNADASANKLENREDGGERIEIVSLDEDIRDEITFIKMDIEGAEQDAILGCQKAIRSYHPKLAVCTYHGYEDIWKIPFMIDSICPGYQFYFRHYGGNLIPTEFVLLCRYPAAEDSLQRV